MGMSLLSMEVSLTVLRQGAIKCSIGFVNEFYIKTNNRVGEAQSSGARIPRMALVAALGLASLEC